jgi:hypothetical protein
MNKFKVGQKVRLTGRITVVNDDPKYVQPYRIHFLGDEKPSNALSLAAMSHAEIIEEPPVKFSKEQVEAIKQAFPKFENIQSVLTDVHKFLDDHTESET